MLEALLWAAVSGFVARAFLSRAKPGPVVTILAGLCGCLLAFLVSHELLRMHEFHLFEPDSLIPAVTASAMILVAIRRALASSQRARLFR